MRTVFCVLFTLCLLQPLHCLMDAVAIGGIFNAFDSNTRIRETQSQYLAAFLMAVREINNKTDGIYDTILPNTELKVIVRHADSGAALAQTAVTLLENDRIRGSGESVHAVISAIELESQHQVDIIDGIFTQSQTVQVVTSLMHNDISMSPMLSNKYNVQLSPQPTVQALIWQHTLCQYQYTEIALFHLDTVFGKNDIELLLNGHHCPITVTTSHAIKPGQEHFEQEIVTTDAAQLTVFLLFLDVDTAVPFLTQAHHYGLLRLGHQLVLSSELMTSELWSRLPNDAVSVLSGAFVIQYNPMPSLKSPVGESFQQRFRSLASTRNNGVCDASLDDSDGTHYLYRSEDGSQCAGLNHSAITSIADFAPEVGLVYDGVIALAHGLHQLLYVRNQTAVDAAHLISAIDDEVEFSGVSGDFSIETQHDVSGLVRHSGFVYDVYGFIPHVYETSNHTIGFAYVADYNDVRGAMPCSLSDPRCTRHVYNTHDGLIPPVKARYVESSLPEVLKIGLLFHKFKSDGSIDTDSVQQLAAFLMAVREINNKTDGIADDVLPNTKIVISLRSSHDMTELQTEVEAAALRDFGTGADTLVSRMGLLETMASYAIQRSLMTTMTHFGTNSYLLENDLIAPLKVQPSHSSTLFGSALQSLICEQYDYRKVAIFVSSGDAVFVNAYAEILSGEFCDLTVLSEHILERSDCFKPDLNAAIASGARVLVLLTDARSTLQLAKEGLESGLFGANRQVFVHASSLDALIAHPQLANEALHGFIGLREAPNYNINTSSIGKAFVSRWRQQPSTAGKWEGGREKCDETRDDNDSTPLYQSSPSFVANATCAGLNFSSFAEDGSDLAPYVAHAYDTAMLLARGYHNIIQAGIPLDDRFAVYGMMMSHVEFDGVSGHVKMYDASATPNILGKGTRRHGEHFEVVNVVRSAKSANGTYISAPSINPIGVWELGKKFSYCNSELLQNCHQAVYFTHDNSIPAEMRHTILLRPQIGGFRACSMLLVCLAVLTLLLYVKVTRRVIRKAYCSMLPAICLGALAIACQMWIFTYEKIASLCHARLILFYFGITMFFGPIALTAMHCHHTPSTPNPSLHRWNIMQAAAALFSLTATIIVGVVSAQYTVAYYDVTTQNQVTRYSYCEYRDMPYSNALMISHLAMLIYGMYCAYCAKDKDDPLQEVRTAYVVLLLFLSVTAIAYPAWATLNIEPSTLSVIIEYNIGGIFILCFIILLLNKFYLLFSSDLVSDDNEPAKLRPPTIEELLSQGRGKCGATVRALMSSMTIENKVTLCHQQIGEWMTLLMMEREGNTTSGCFSDDYVMNAPDVRSNHPIFPFSHSRREYYELAHCPQGLADIPEEDATWDVIS